MYLQLKQGKKDRLTQYISVSEQKHPDHRELKWPFGFCSYGGVLLSPTCGNLFHRSICFCVYFLVHQDLQLHLFRTHPDTLRWGCSSNRKMANALETVSYLQLPSGLIWHLGWRLHLLYIPLHIPLPHVRYLPSISRVTQDNSMFLSYVTFPFPRLTPIYLSYTPINIIPTF